MSKARYLYSELATLVQARRNCADKIERYTLHTEPWQIDEQENAREWFDAHTARIKSLVRDLMPSGSGIDRGTKIDLDASHPTKLVFTFGYHHMNRDGFYDGWTEHMAIVTPTFDGINIRITGRNRDDIKDHLYQTFDAALCQVVRWDAEAQTFDVVHAQ